MQNAAQRNPVATPSTGGEDVRPYQGDASDGLMQGSNVRLSPERFRQVITSRGWRMSDVAWRWQISPEHLSRLMADRDRASHWDDAVLGLPAISRADAARIRKARLAAQKQRAERREAAGVLVVGLASPSGPGYSYHGYLVVNSIVAATSAIGDMAEAGDEGYVSEIRDDGQGEEYLVVFEYGQDWFREIDVERYLVETGKEKT